MLAIILKWLQKCLKFFQPRVSSTDFKKPADFDKIVWKFEGLFTPLWRAADETDMTAGTRQQIVATWQNRIRHIDSLELKQPWDEYRNKHFSVDYIKSDMILDNNKLQSFAADWLKVLIFWGVKRDETAEIQIDEENEFTFIIEPSAYNYGDRAKVTSPPWHYEKRVVEKGIAQVIHTS